MNRMAVLTITGQGREPAAMRVLIRLNKITNDKLCHDAYAPRVE